MHVGIVGAGISGLTCAHTLAEFGHRVTLFDKGRGPGGRMSRRRMSTGDDSSGPPEAHFDHGTQYFTARDDRFAQIVERWMHAGVTAAWEARLVSIDPDPAQPGGIATVPRRVGTPRFVGVPGMNEVVKHAADTLPDGCEVTFGTRVERLQRRGTGWVFEDASGVELGRYDAAVIAVPSVQAAALLADVPDLRARAEQVRMKPCWAAMLAFAEPLGLGFEGAFLNLHAPPGLGLSGGALSWLGNNSSKPGRQSAGAGRGVECWVAHASPAWSAARVEDTAEAVLPILTGAFFEAVGLDPRDTVAAAAHRWRYANVDAPLPESCLHDESLHIGACGDWCGGSRVEGHGGQAAGPQRRGGGEAPLGARVARHHACAVCRRRAVRFNARSVFERSPREPRRDADQERARDAQHPSLRRRRAHQRVSRGARGEAGPAHHNHRRGGEQQPELAHLPRHPAARFVDEARQEAQEENRDLGVEQVHQHRLPEDRGQRAACRPVIPARKRGAGLARREQHPHAEVRDVDRPGRRDERVEGGHGLQDRGDAQGGGGGVHEAPGREPGRGRHGRQPPLRRAAGDDVDDVGPGGGGEKSGGGEHRGRGARLEPDDHFR